jgi:hypothetical protein
MSRIPNVVARSVLVAALGARVAFAQEPAAAPEPTDPSPTPDAAPPSPTTSVPAEPAKTPEPTPVRTPTPAPATAEAALPFSGPELTEVDELEPRPLTISGFVDFGFNRFFTSHKSQLNFLFPTRAATFVLGNINLFFDANPAPGWRAFVEVRFTNLPHGEEISFADPLGGQYERRDTRVSDYTSTSLRNDVVLGSIIIERAWAEYAFDDALKVQTGYFLTPYGIWNQDHGTPTLISLLLPAFQADQYIPNRQLGIQLYGSFYPSGWQLGYHAYVANSRGPSQVDLGNEKAFGGRLFASSLGSSVKTTVGASGYYGTERNNERRVVSVDPYRLETTELGAMREWAVAVDTAIDAGPLRVRTEGMLQRREAIDGTPRLYSEPDHHSWDGYVLAAYALPWAGLEPYAYFEAMHYPSNLGDTVLIPSAGLNVHFSPSAQLKTQYAHAMFRDFSVESDRTPSDNDVHNVSARLVVSF